MKNVAIFTKVNTLPYRLYTGFQILTVSLGSYERKDSCFQTFILQMYFLSQQTRFLCNKGLKPLAISTSVIQYYDTIMSIFIFE